MAERPKDFGRRKPVTGKKPPAEPATPREAAAAAGGRTGAVIPKRTLAIGFVTAGALAASAMHFAGPTPAVEKCVPTSTNAAPGPTGTPLPALGTTIDGTASAGGIGGPEPCPPGTRRSTSSSHHYSSSSSGRRSLLSGWGWSSSSSSSSAKSSSARPVSAMATGHASSSSISRGGFGSTGGHFSGGS
mgnify:CR=1 FL=1